MKNLLLLLCLVSVIIPLSALEPSEDLPDLRAQGVALMDAATGTLLFSKNGDEEISPASLTKLMTIHVALTEVAAGNASLDEIVPLSRQSWAINQPPRSSLMFLAAGQRVTLRELILGLAIPSGNDAAVAVALRFAPSVEEFVERMNQEARNLGLSHTYFVEPSGISEFNMTTAEEFARLAREYLRLHPETLTEYHSVREFAYPKAENVAEAYRDRPGTIVQHNTNSLLGVVEGVDGLKTGYIDEAGYNIALTALRGETRLIAVVLGAPSSRIREEDGRNIINWGFEHFQTLRPEFGPLEPAPVWKGKQDFVDLVPVTGSPGGDSFSLTFTTYTGRGTGLRWHTEYMDPIIAPIPAGTALGDLVLSDTVGELRRIPLITPEDIEEGGFFKRLWHSIRLFFRDLFK